MARSNKDIEISARAKELVEAQLGDRGRFAMLEEMSGIAIGQWKNFFYGRQLLNEKMLAFLVKKYPHDQAWLLTGERPPAQDKFPFLAPVPKESDCETAGARLNWVIREFASPHGTKLFEYLEQSSTGNGTRARISAADWAQVILGVAEPTFEMIAAVCQRRPHFTEWVVLGSAVSPLQVDPTSESSVVRWKTQAAAKWAEIEKKLSSSKKNGNKKS